MGISDSFRWCRDTVAAMGRNRYRGRHRRGRGISATDPQPRQDTDAG